MAMQTKAAVDGLAWVGWHRPTGGQGWHRVCEAESAEGCLQLLLAMTEGGLTRVLPRERKPAAELTRRPWRERRRRAE